VILIGEIRDRETMQSAINLSGTGHLVLATLHANNAAETLDRIINMFPRDQHHQIFLDLSQYLRAIIAQRLVMGNRRKRVAAVEVMLNTPHIAELVARATSSRSRKADPASPSAASAASRASTSRSTKLVQDEAHRARGSAGEPPIRAGQRLEAKINFG
jgi:twitching motility protein PilU